MFNQNQIRLQNSPSKKPEPNSLENARRSVADFYGKKLRLRVCGLWIQDEKILVIRHKGIGSKGYLWAPPGGGVSYGEHLKDALKREILEECNSEVAIGDFVLTHEYLGNELHTVELFFLINPQGCTPSLGIDPEMRVEHQIMDEMKFVSFEDALTEGLEYYHGIFKAGSISNLLNQRWV